MAFLGANAEESGKEGSLWPCSSMWCASKRKHCVLMRLLRRRRPDGHLGGQAPALVAQLAGPATLPGLAKP